MLGTEFKGISSFPVGYVEHIVMRPMDFEEFCWANSVSENVLAGIRSCLVEKHPVENYIHEAMLKNYRAYIVCGGMPEVVQNYIDSGYSLVSTRELQTQLVDQYKSDISKYASTRAFNVRSILSKFPFSLRRSLIALLFRLWVRELALKNMSRISCGLLTQVLD